MDLRRRTTLGGVVYTEKIKETLPPEVYNELVLVYNVTSTNNPTQLLCDLESHAGAPSLTLGDYTYTDWDLNQLDSMWIGESQYSPSKTHTFTSTGLHTVKLRFNSSFNCMSFMFAGCTNLVSVDFTNCDTSKVTQMAGLFGDCISLTNVNFAAINTSNVVTMMGMFDTCSALSSVDVSMFNTEKVTCMQYMFNLCTSLTSINLSNFNTPKLTDMYKMFTGCSNLVTANLSGFVTSKVIDMSYLFQSCSKLQTLDMRNIGSTAISNSAQYGYMLSGCLALQTFYWGMKTAPTVNSNTFGNSNSTYTGYTNRSKGTNKLYLPTGYSGYNSGYWNSRLKSTRYGGFSFVTY